MPNLATEEADLRRFLDQCGDVAGFIKDPDHREKPDFLIRKDNVVIGVEHTQIFHRTGSNSLQAMESIEDKIIAKAECIYATRGGVPLDVDVVFYSGEPIPRSKMNTIAEFIVDGLLHSLGKAAPEVMQSVVVIKGGNCLDSDGHDGYPVILFLSYTVMPAPGYGIWKVSRAGWLMPNMIEQVYARIREKDANISDYHKVCPKCVLLIAGGHNPSGYFKFDSGTIGYRYPTRFDAVYLIHRFELGVQCLKIRRYETMSSHERLQADVDARLAFFEAMGRGLVLKEDAYLELQARVHEAGPEAVARFMAMDQSG